MLKKHNPQKIAYILLGLILAFTATAQFRSKTVSAAPEAVTITVDSTNDADAADGVCTLREAILAANNNASQNECTHDGSAGLDTIAFAIGTPGSSQTLAPLTNLPTITEPVVLDGWTQGGSGYTGPPLIEIDGSNLNTSSSGFRISGGGSTVRGFVIHSFDDPSSSAIWLHSADGNWITGNYIGLNAAGTAVQPNHYGIWINNRGNSQPSHNNIIGTDGDGVDDATEGNVIAGSIQEDVRVETDGNWIAGNKIGTNPAGAASFTNNNTAVRLYRGGTSLDPTGFDNVVGTNGDGISDDLEGNLISGHNYGVGINNSSGHTIAGNIIGLDAGGSVILGNDFNGIECIASAEDSRDIRIGSNEDGVSDDLEGNLISGNGSRGFSTFDNGCRHITINGNKIGTDLSGTLALGNGAEGILISAGDWYTITNNLISGNGTNGTADGINASSGANNVTITGNTIGSDATGTTDLGNTGHGIQISFSDNLTVRDNLISGNGSSGILISSGDANLIHNNLIGVQVDGAAALGNDDDGLNIFGIAVSNTVISNTLAFNGRHGIVVDGNQAISNTLSANAIFNNVELGIDLDLDGVTPIDADDGDTGPNGLQNHPTVLSGVNTADQITISGALDSTPSTTFTLEFFSNPACDFSGYGEGEIYLGSGSVTTDVNGDGPYAIILPVLVPEGRYLTATATGPEGTSEFSVCFGPTGPVQDSEITGLTAVNDGPQLDNNPVVLSATVTTGNNVIYTWNPGDGSGILSGQVVTHTYSLPGMYTAVVTATNSVSEETAPTDVTINRSSTLNGYVWDDVDGDGTVGPGETRFAGEIIRTVQNGLVFTTTTAANGSYLLRGLRAGSYTLFSPAINGYKTYGSSVRILSIPVNGMSLGQWLPYQADFTGVRGRAWLDDNFDGRYDSGETILENHDVTLTSRSDPVFTITVPTDSDGLYLFTLGQAAGSSHTLTGDPPNLYQPLSRTLNGANQNGATANLNFKPGAIGGCIGQTGGATISGLSVALRDSSGQEVATTTTGGDGCYLFSPAEAQNATTAHLSPAGSDLVVGSEIQPAVYLGTPLQVNWDVTVPATVGMQIISVDGVSYLSPQRDFSGYEVLLTTESDLITATTDLRGYASFENVTPGLITATIPLSDDIIGVTPSRWEYDLPPGTALYWAGFELGTHGITAECRTPSVPGQDPRGRTFPCTVELRRLEGSTFVNVTSQQLAADEQFFYQPQEEGYYQIQIYSDLPGVNPYRSELVYQTNDSYHIRYPFFLPDQVGPISGEVWIDANANGTRETGEEVAPGFAVELLDPSGTVLESRTTDDYGRYHLYPDGFGSYSVRLTPPASVLLTTPGVRSIYRDPADLNSSIVDFGLAQLAEGIEGRVRFNDGWRSNASGVTVELRTPAGDFIDSTTTGPIGYFSFDSLVPDQYLVRVLPPNGGTPVDRLVTASVSGTPLQLIMLPPDGNQPTVFVYADENGNEVADPGEGLANVSVAFDIGACGNVINISQTDSDGFAPSDFVFPDGGCARVTSGLPEGMSPARPEGTPLAPYDNSIVPLEIIAEGTVLIRPFWDVNGNGALDTTEPLLLREIGISAPPSVALIDTGTALILRGPAGSYQLNVSPPETGLVWSPVTAVIPSGSQSILHIPVFFMNQLSGEVIGPNSSAVSGLTIELRDENNTLIATTTTGVAPISQPAGRSYTPPPAATGGPAAVSFTFDDIAPGSYTVRIANPPTNMVTSPAEISFDPANGGSVQLRLNPIDTISGVVYWDYDYDGRWNLSEPGTNFYDVVLLNDAGLPEQQITPATDGTFVFTGLQPDVQYALTVPALYLEIGGSVTSNWISASPGWFERGTLAQATIGIGHYDFDSPNSLAYGQVYVPNSGGVAGATVGYYQLEGNAGFCNDGNATILGETTTDSNGHYVLPLAFVPTETVRYCLVVLEAPGLVQDDLTVTALAALLFQYEDGRMNIYQAINNDKDIRMRPITNSTSTAGDRAMTNTHSVTWSAFRDENLNGMWDAGEFPLPGVGVDSGTVTGTSGLNGTGILTLADGEHQLSINPSTGYAPVGPATQSVFIQGSDVVLPPIGFTPAGQVSGIIFADKDGDGWLGSTGDEFGLGGVAVTLAGPQTATATTAADGRFSLPDLPDGTYTISANLPVGYTAESVSVTVHNGFGLVRLPSQSTTHLTGALYHDWDGDGLRLADEPLANTVPVTVTVDGVGSTLPLGGSLLFWDVAPGSYTAQPWWTAAMAANITVGPNDGGGFGLPAVDPGVLRGTLWVDANGDSLRQPWEAPLSGVAVTLDGTETTYTNALGRFIFAQVTEEDHSLSVALPAGLEADIPAFSIVEGRGAAIGIAASPIPLQADHFLFQPVIVK